jgi:hypothetical protein
MAGEPTGRETERQLGLYILRERTARRLVVERTGTPVVSVIAVGGLFLLLIAATAPWRGGTRVPIAISLAGMALAIGLLIAGFVPHLERLTVDLETRECRLEQVYLLARRTHTLRVPLDRVGEVRCRRRIWQEAPDAAVIRWSVELVGEGKTWPLAEDDQEEPMQELARLVAEVAGIPRRSFIAEGGLR